MGSVWVHISSLPVPYPYYEIGENPNPYIPKPSQIGENPSNQGWFGRLPMGMGFVAMLNIILQNSFNFYDFACFGIPP